MPVKKQFPNRKDIGVIPHIDSLQAHLENMVKQAISQPLTSEHKNQLVSLSISAMKAAGMSPADITAEIHSQFPSPVSEVPAPVKANTPPTSPSTASFMTEPPPPKPVTTTVVPASPEKTGLFGKR